MHVALRGNIYVPVRVTDLVEVSKDATSLLVCTWKNFLLGECVFFCEWRQKWRTFRPPWPTLLGPGRQPLGGSISLKFLLETRLHSESFDTLGDLLRFWVQKLWLGQVFATFATFFYSFQQLPKYSKYMQFSVSSCFQEFYIATFCNFSIFTCQFLLQFLSSIEQNVTV